MKESDVPLKEQASIIDTADKTNSFSASISTTEYDGETSPPDSVLPVGTP